MSCSRKLTYSNNQTQLFVELLQVSLGTREQLSRVPNAYEWAELLNEAQRQTIVGVLADGLETLPHEQLPPKEILLQWIGLTQIVENTFSLHVERAKELTIRFAETGYKTCVLKGVSSAARYPNPKRRECGDIDIWVSGNRKEVMSWLRTQCELGSVFWHHVDAKFFEDVPVEVHFHPSWLYNPRHNASLQRWFAKQGQVLFDQTINEKGFVATNAGFDAVYQLLHCFHHLLEEGIGLRHIVDYYYTVSEIGSKREEVLIDLKRLGLLKFASAMMWVQKEVCGMPDEKLLCEPNETEGKFLLCEIMAGGNFGKTRIDDKLRNTFSRWTMMAKHYPSEALWMFPWKVWHKCWRMIIIRKNDPRRTLADKVS